MKDIFGFFSLLNFRDGHYSKHQEEDEQGTGDSIISSKKAPVIKLIKKPKVKKINTLRINLVNGVFCSYSVDNCSDDPTEPWNDFYNWYTETKLEYYIMKYRTGVCMLRRVDIQSFSCNINETIEQAN